MTEELTKRKLRAILTADVKGYSLLMADNELATIATLKSYRQKMTLLIQQHQGRVVDSPGDNILAEFASAVDAITCAVKIQEELKERNAELSEDRKMQFRIGINIGDIVQDADRIYGDGVNVAARIEGLAEPGGICISRNTYDHIKDKLKLGYEYLGEHEVKNIKDPVRVYKVLMDPRNVGKLLGEKKRPLKTKWVVFSAIVIIAFCCMILLFYIAKTGPFDKELAEEVPSIAVLPFNNLSNDPEQEYFSDGMTDDIITDLAKISGLMVISSNSTFTYKGKEIKIPVIAKELGVKYVLEGSIRRAGNEVRINAQLIDAVTDHHIWADRFDGKNENIFDLQDKITERIVSALSVKLSDPEQKVITDTGTDNFLAYEEYLKGMNYMRKFTPKDYVKAIGHFKKAIEIDRNYSQAYASLAQTYMSALQGGKRFWDEIGTDWPTTKLLARYYVELAMKKPTSRSYQALALLELYKRNFSRAVDYAEHAVAISPNDADALHNLGRIMVFADNPVEGIKYLKRSIMLDPLHKSTGGIGFAYFTMGDYEQAVKYIEKQLKDYPETYGVRAILASAYAFLGNDIKAKKAFEEFWT
jgi:adenylate cyclase